MMMSCGCRILAVVLATAVVCNSSVGALSLEDGFRNPPDSAKPQTWYHLMNGNVTKEGITRDFEEIAKAGLGGVQIFDVGCDIPPGDVRFGSAEWFDVLRHAHNEAKRLGLRLGIHNCSGWSCSGGPWVKPADDMQYGEVVDVPMSCFWMDASCGPGKFPCFDNSHYAASLAHVWARA